MAKLTVLFLAAILAAVVYGVVAQARSAAAEKRERDERTLTRCWENAVNDGAGVALCEDLERALK